MVCTLDGKKHNSIEIFPNITGFIIEGNGTFNVTIEYSSERWFITGVYVSAICSMIIALLGRFKVRRDVAEKRKTEDFTESVESPIPITNAKSRDPFSLVNIFNRLDFLDHHHF